MADMQFKFNDAQKSPAVLGNFFQFAKIFNQLFNGWATENRNLLTDTFLE